MRTPVFAHHRFLSSHLHQRSAIRAVTSRSHSRRISTDIKRRTSSLAVETNPNNDVAKAVLLHPRHKNVPSFNCEFLSSGFFRVFTIDPPAQDRSPILGYQKLVESGSLKPDQHQTRIVQKLQRLHDNLANHGPAPLPALPTTSSLVSSPPMFGTSCIPNCVYRSLACSPGDFNLIHSLQINHLGDYTYTEMSEQARQCSWIYSTIIYTHISRENEECIFTHS